MIKLLPVFMALSVLADLSAATDRVPGDRSPDRVDIRLTADAQVVSAGDSIRVDIDVVAMPGGRNEAFALARALGGADHPHVLGPARIVRDTGVQSRPGDVVAGSPVYRFGRVFTLVTTGSGTIEIGPVTITWNEAAVSSNDATVFSAVPLDPEFDPSRSIMPIRSESRLDDGTVLIRRSGTAFLVAGHAIVTSYHVVMDAHRISVRMPSGRQVEIDRGWALDPERDIALLYVDQDAVSLENMKPLAMAGGDLRSSFTWSVGWRSGWLDRTVGVPLESDESDGDRRWTTTNPVRSGDSGSPLLTADGRVLGVITAGTVVQPRTEVLRREVCLAVDPRPLLEALTRGRPPEPLAGLTASESIRSDPFAMTFRAGTEFSIRRSRRLPAESEWIDTLYGVIERADADGDARLLYAAGMTARLSGRDSMAKSAFESALGVDPAHPDASYMLGLMSLQDRSFEIAAAHFERASESPMYHHLALYGLARSLMGLHRFDEAETLLRQVIDYDDRFAPALFDRGRIHVSRGRPDHASMAVVRLGAIDEYWGRRLKRIIDNPVFAPAPLSELPRMPLPDSPSAFMTPER